MKNLEPIVTVSFRARVSDLVRRAIRGTRGGNGGGSAHHRAARSLFMTPRPAVMAYTAIFVAFCGTVGAAEKKKPKSLTMTLSANVSVVRSEVMVRARVEPDARSRELIIEWVADDLSGGSHAISLEGARAAAAHRYTLKHLTPGQYVVTAILRRNDGTETRSESNLWVVGVGETVAFGGNAIQGSAGGILRPATRP
jgi:hypothetical protein